GRLVRELRGHKTAVAALAFTPDGKTLLSQGRVRVGLVVPGDPATSETDFRRAWDVATGEQLRSFPGAALGANLTSPSPRRVALRRPDGGDHRRRWPDGRPAGGRHRRPAGRPERPYQPALPGEAVAGRAHGRLGGRGERHPGVGPALRQGDRPARGAPWHGLG